MTYHVSNVARSQGDPKVLRSGPSSLGGADRLARGLGWFSVGLGLAELLAPRLFTRALGMRGSEGLVRAYGAREVASGLLALSPDRGVGLWGRVAGDGLDLATLLAALRPDNPKRGNAGLALAMALGVTLLDILAAQGVAARHGRRGRGGRHDYRDRSGFPRGVASARGAAAPTKALPDARAAPTPA
jgi:hypothetical protein